MAPYTSRPRRTEIDPAWAWEPYEPGDRRPWTPALAGHLYRRAGFGATSSELDRARVEGPRRTLDRLLRPEGDHAAFARRFDEYERSATGGGPSDGVRAWWLRRMIETPHPLLEKMTLFWHGRFAASASRVKEARTVQRHVALLRRHALGSYRSLLEEVSRDPALLLTVGAGENRRAAPRPGFARGLRERFTVGPGHFGEEDVREAARAFTGDFVRRERFRFVPREHDEGTKRILGRSGAFTRDDALAIALEHRAASRNLTRDLYRFLVSEAEEPSPALVAPLADSFAQDHDTARLVETMLRSNLFFSEHAVRRRIKSPVELAVGIVRGLEGMVATTTLARDLARLGCDLLHPPTLAGWAGGRHWIDRVSLGRRHALAAALLNGSGRYGGKLDPGARAGERGSAGAVGGFLRALFLQGGAAAGDPPPDARRAVRALVVLPEFQLA